MLLYKDDFKIETSLDGGRGEEGLYGLSSLKCNKNQEDIERYSSALSTVLAIGRSPQFQWKYTGVTQSQPSSSGITSDLCQATSSFQSLPN